jgi:predicted RNase H-like HicB family nuclease
MAGQLEMPAPRTVDETATDGGEAAYAAIAVYDGHQWASLCPELDVASVGGSPEEAIDNLIGAVEEALQLAADEGMDRGAATPDDEIRRFMASSLAPFHLLRFYA